MPQKIGIVGMSGIGNLHAQCHKDNPMAELIAVCDVVKERADAAAEKYGVKAYYSLKDMIENEPDLQIVDVTTGGIDNGSWHFEPAMEALSYKKHVLVEKPIAHDIFEAREMVAYAEKQKVYLGCNLNHYFSPPAEKAKQYIEGGEVGELVYAMMKTGFNGGEENYAPAGSPKIKGHPYFHMKAYLTHPFSVMRHFCGDITHIQTFSDRPSFRRRAGDVMVSINSIHMKFENGGVGYLMSQRGDAVFGLGGWWSFEMAGTKGTFCIENCVEKLTMWRAKKGIPAISVQPEAEVTDFGTNDFNKTFSYRLKAFVEDVENGVAREDLRASGRDALAVLEYTFAVINSYESGGELVRPYALPTLHGDPKFMR